MKTLRFSILIFGLMIMAGCETYYLSTDSLLEQFANTGKQRKYIFMVTPHFFFAGSVKGNSLKTVHCVDKDGKEYFLSVNERMGIRITTKDSTRRTFYFDTLLIQDSTITGSKTHFFEWQIKPIKLDDVVKLEIQK